MRNWTHKTDFHAGEQGVVTPADFNSFFRETKNAVEPFMALDENDNFQLIKSINGMSKTLYYEDIGTVNNIVLRHPQIDHGIVTYQHGMTLFFKCKNTNTSSTVLQVEGLSNKTVYLNGGTVPAGYLEQGKMYMIVYNASTRHFELTGIQKEDTSTGAYGNSNETFQASDGVETKDAVTVNQLSEYMLKTAVVNHLGSSSITSGISLNQMHILHGLVSTIQNKLNVNDSSLDTFQEIVNYIKDNRNALSGLTIPSISGLQDALNGKAPASHNHDNLYMLRSDVHSTFADKAELNGNGEKTFAVKYGTGSNNAITNYRFKLRYRAPLWDYYTDFDPTPVTNPATVSETWLNTHTGIFFMCTDITHDENVWIGTEHRIIDPYGDILKTRNAVGLYEFEDSLEDYRGVHPASSEGVSYVDTYKRFGSKSLLFSGTSYCVKFDVPSGTVIRSISLWCKLRDMTGNDRYLIHADSTHYVKIVDGDNAFTVSNGSLYIDDAVTTNSINGDGEFHHYCFIFHDDMPSVAIGNVNGSGTPSSGINGYIDQVRLFNDTVSSDDLTILANES